LEKHAETRSAGDNQQNKRSRKRSHLEIVVLPIKILQSQNINLE